MVELQELEKRYFWSERYWITIDTVASNDKEHYVLKNTIATWRSHYPQAEVINESILF